MIAPALTAALFNAVFFFSPFLVPGRDIKSLDNCNDLSIGRNNSALYIIKYHISEYYQNFYRSFYYYAIICAKFKHSSLIGLFILFALDSCIKLRFTMVICNFDEETLRIKSDFLRKL